MLQIRVRLTDEEVNSLQQYETRANVAIDELVREYLAYLLEGGSPIARIDSDDPTSEELARIAVEGGSFDWLWDEPDLYSEKDGEPL